MAKIDNKKSKWLTFSLKELWAGFIMFLTVAESIVYFKIYAKLYTGDQLGYYFALIISMIIGTFVVGMMSGIPLVVSCGIGINTFIFTIVMGSNGLGFNYSNILLFLLIDGLIYLIFSLCGKEGVISKSIPEEIKKGLPIAVGLLLIIFGLDMAISTTNNSIYSFQFIGFKNFEVMMCLVITAVSLFLIIGFKKKNMKFACFLVVIISTIIYIGIRFLILHELPFNINEIYDYSTGIQSLKDNFLFKAINSGFDFSSVMEGYGQLKGIAISIGICLVLLMYIMYTAEAVSYSTVLVSKVEKDERVNLGKRISIGSALSTIIGAIVGAPCISVSEMSICGSVENGRSRLSVISTCIFLLLSLIFFPLLRIVPNCVAGFIIIYSGLVLATQIKDINWAKLEECIPILLMIAITLFTKNIAAGVGMSMISYIVLACIKKEGKKINSGTWFFSVMFLITMILSF